VHKYLGVALMLSKAAVRLPRHTIGDRVVVVVVGGNVVVVVVGAIVVVVVVGAIVVVVVVVVAGSGGGQGHGYTLLPTTVSPPIFELIVSLAFRELRIVCHRNLSVTVDES
jgi:hypothetical protein